MILGSHLKRQIFTALTTAVLVIFGAPSLAQSKNAVRVAVFSQPGFPAHFAGNMPTPQAIADRLQTLGISATTLSADRLADPVAFNADNFALLVLPYGNTYPLDALENLKTFRSAGGGFVMTGVPFTHPVIRERGMAAGWGANPHWGDKVRVVQTETRYGRNALVLEARTEDWAGAWSPRFAVKAGSRLTVSAWVRQVSGIERGGDQLFVRFFDASGKFLGQPGLFLPRGDQWQLIRDEIPVPPTATHADVSPQMWSRQRVLQLDQITVTENGGNTNLVPNASFESAEDRWRDLGHSDRAAQPLPEGLGVGGFADPPRGAEPPSVAPDDPLGLAVLALDWSGSRNAQHLNVRSLPQEDVIIPILGTRQRPVAAVIVHRHPDYKGAVDVWAHRGPEGEKALLGAGQIVIRSVIAALRLRGLISSQQERAAFTRLDQLAGVGGNVKNGKTAQ